MMCRFNDDELNRYQDTGLTTVVETKRAWYMGVCLEIRDIALFMSWSTHKAIAATRKKTERCRQTKTAKKY
jgi:hypothetical protein